MIITLLEQAKAPTFFEQYGTIIMIVLMFAIIYFLMIRPQSKQQKRIAEFRRSLQVGQEVVTTGGIHGTIKAIGDSTITLKVATGVDMVFDKTAIMPQPTAGK